MREHFTQLSYVIAAVLFILGLRSLTRPDKARQGMQMAAVGMLFAICGTLVNHEIVDYRWIAGGLVLGAIIAVSAVTGFVGVVTLIDSIREGTLIFKDLVIPKWWLDWIIPLTSLAMGLQALEMMVAHAISSTPVSHDPSAHIPGIQPGEMP
jgi:hypothetical protein